MDDHTRFQAAVEACLFVRQVQPVCDEYQMLFLLRYIGWIMNVIVVVNEILKTGHRLNLDRT